MEYTAAIYRGEGRPRWAILHIPTNTYTFTEKGGYLATVKRAKELNKAQPPVRDVRSPLARFHVYYLNTRTVIEARHEGEAERIGAERWGTTTKAVKAFRIH